ncbi:DegT/DnrJ/EryC1/StrS family aminotransferase [Patescibacteria group bacterium]|nr:DegT/DnrJ/EryC1/StrS family aminotransferase [Patescibacteria group bacterium]
MIRYNVPTLGKEEERAAVRVLRSHWVAEGKEVERFENELCRFLGAQSGHAAALSSGSAALYVALKVLGVGLGHEVVAPSYACSAILDAIFLAGAVPVLVDIGEDDLNISAAQAKRRVNGRTKAVIATHTYGVPADMRELSKLGVPIVEDAAQAIGAKYAGKPAGVSGDIAVFSFGATKMLTSGNGGMVFSQKKELVERVKEFRAYEEPRGHKQRFNFQLSDLQAAIGRVQLKKLPGFLRKRKSIARRYLAAFPKELVWPGKFEDRETNWYRFLVRSQNPSRLQKEFRRVGVDTRIPRESFDPLHRRLKLNWNEFPVSERTGKTMLSLPLYPSLKESEVARIIQAGRRYIQ